MKKLTFLRVSLPKTSDCDAYEEIDLALVPGLTLANIWVYKDALGDQAAMKN